MLADVLLFPKNALCPWFKPLYEAISKDVETVKPFLNLKSSTPGLWHRRKHEQHSYVNLLGRANILLYGRPHVYTMDLEISL